MKASRKMLLVAYLFPPIGGGGVPRALKMAKYLAEDGWEVHVLTVDDTYYATRDDSLLRQLPENVIIHRAQEWNPVQKMRPPQKESPKRDRSQEAAAVKTGEGLRQAVRQKVVPMLKKIKNTLMIPDDMIGWMPFAVKLGEEVIKKHNIPIMFSTSGPYTNHLVGRSLKRKTGVVWIADFRDPWTQNMHRSGVAWREAWEERMERSVMAEADAITTVTHGFAENFMKKFGKEIKRMEVIHNGFDPNDYLDIATPPEDGKFTLAYPGIFYKERNPRLLLQAVAELIQEGKVDRASIVLRFAGVFDYPGYSDNIDCVRRLGLEDIVDIQGNLPHKKALEMMKGADVLMLIGDTAPGSGVYIPGKLYEYMAIGHPILALSVEGESTEIIRKFHLGEVVNPLNKDEIKQAFLRMYEQWKENPGCQADRAGEILRRAEDGDLAIYNRQVQARMLGELMEELLAAKW
ncbi:glycosyl transferase family 1 [Aneurinibacillus sp. XH2]|uniref:glycosyltransferase family 4 protein n=1 Tax=Aneurinibacillus sp. XH2 TaxID=1450761 RepID=UPI00070E024C|nr:glycosyltransferase family 4 protein [Aneurinibacillus sp. XH2]AMA72027.1 glycosyl transferase family 1 [Aneurinibacillus sp. XH2]